MFNLSEDLRLANDHGVEASGHAENVAHDIVSAVLVEMLTKRRYISQEIVANETMQIGAALGRDGEFHAVASREHDAFRNSGILQQSPGSFLKAPLWNCQPFTHLDGSGLVVHAQELKFHRATNLWTPLK